MCWEIQSLSCLPSKFILTHIYINMLRSRNVFTCTKKLTHLLICMPGAIVGDPTHDKVMRRRPDMQGRSGHKGPSRLTPASTPPCILPPFLLLFLVALLQILVLPAESSPAPLSLNEDHLKTLINKCPRRWYPMKGPKRKEMLQLKPFWGHSGLFGICVLLLQRMLMTVLSILSTVC